MGERKKPRRCLTGTRRCDILNAAKGFTYLPLQVSDHDLYHRDRFFLRSRSRQRPRKRRRRSNWPVQKASLASGLTSFYPGARRSIRGVTLCRGMRTMHSEDTIQGKPCQVKRYIIGRNRIARAKTKKRKCLKNNAGTAFLNLSRRKFLKLCAGTHSFRTPEPHENKTDSGGKRTLRITCRA